MGLLDEKRIIYWEDLPGKRIIDSEQTGGLLLTFEDGYWALISTNYTEFVRVYYEGSDPAEPRTYKPRFLKGKLITRLLVPHIAPGHRDYAYVVFEFDRGPNVWIGGDMLETPVSLQD